MAKIKCDKRKGGCEYIFPLDKNNNETERYIQCPCCGRMIINPFYRGNER